MNIPTCSGGVSCRVAYRISAYSALFVSPVPTGEYRISAYSALFSPVPTGEYRISALFSSVPTGKYRISALFSSVPISEYRISAYSALFSPVPTGEYRISALFSPVQTGEYRISALFSPVQTGEYWIGVFTLRNCYPIREVVIADYQQVNSTITTNFFDIVLGISNPDDFIPPPECQQAQWGLPSVKVPYL